jgi:hypothetical protein
LPISTMTICRSEPNRIDFDSADLSMRASWRK